MLTYQLLGISICLPGRWWRESRISGVEGLAGVGVGGPVPMGRAKKTFTATLWSPGATEGHCFGASVSSFFGCLLGVFTSVVSMALMEFC